MNRQGRSPHRGKDNAMAVSAQTRVDPVTLEVLRNSLPAIADEMSIDLQRTSYNMMIYEVRDYCCALLDVDGRLISQNVGGVSHFVADLGVIIKDGLARDGRDGFKPGDVVIMNHQRVAGQHLNNVCIYTPFFFDGELSAFAIVRAHWVDIGGMSTGFGASSLVSDPWMEGLQLDQIKLYEGGVPDEKALKIIRDNIRFPDSSMGDLRSQMAACRLAERRLEELFRRYGRDVISAALERIFDDTEKKCRLLVDKIPDGVYEAESWIDPDGPGSTETVAIRVRVIVAGDEMTIDLTNCSQQVKAGINSRTLAGPYIAYKGLTGPLEPVNEGSFRALKVEIQEGNFMMARYPAVMAGWSRALPTVVDTILKALAPALPDVIPAAHLGTLGGSFTFFGFDPAKDKNVILQSIEGGGWGARPYEDGESGSVSVCQGDVRNAPVETIELKSPVLVESRALREDSGGAGKFRGGLGLVTQMKNLIDGRWSVSNSGRRQCPPWGLWGGGGGSSSQNAMRGAGQTEFTVIDPVRTPAATNTSVIVATAGGGGWGDPLDRDPQRVETDVREGFVSVVSAREQYGVAVDTATLKVDLGATAALRSERRRARG
jgi:N-methylhydantoinase B